jgi:hypothetical protein
VFLTDEEIKRVATSVAAAPIDKNETKALSQVASVVKGLRKGTLPSITPLNLSMGQRSTVRAIEVAGRQQEPL